MNILIACEESQRVCMAFREKGHNAYSCDIQEPSGGHPEWHILNDVRMILNPSDTWGDIVFDTMDGKEHQVWKWDLIIAHPPCTYLSNAGARHLFPNGILNQSRYRKGLEAKSFFMNFIKADCDKICVENPIPSKIYDLPKYTQIIEPYYFGHSFKKKTCLWLKGLPNLQSTDICENPQSSKVAGNWFNKGGKERQKNRAKTFEGIAKAMAEQWG